MCRKRVKQIKSKEFVEDDISDFKDKSSDNEKAESDDGISDEEVPSVSPKKRVIRMNVGPPGTVRVIFDLSDCSIYFVSIGKETSCHCSR